MVFLDHMMPQMDGIETKHRIKEEQLCANTPIIMLTANASLTDREIYIKEGFDDFLSKPILVNQLEKLILTYLPKELIQEGKQAEAEPKPKAVQLPKIEEFDLEYAKNLVQKEELVYQFLVDFYKSLSPMAEKLAELYAQMEQTGDFSAYQTEVHALKSTAATVGALLLSKTARLLEVAAKEQDVNRLKVLHPVLMEEITKHKERMKAALNLPNEKETADRVEDAYLEMLISSLKNTQYDAADLICEEIQKYQYPQHIQQMVNALAEKVFQLDAEKALDIIEQIKREQENS